MKDSTVPADKPERITEQDAREILIDFHKTFGRLYSTLYCDSWLETDEAKALLNKLNADQRCAAVSGRWKSVEYEETLAELTSISDEILRVLNQNGLMLSLPVGEFRLSINKAKEVLCREK